MLDTLDDPDRSLAVPRPSRPRLRERLRSVVARGRTTIIAGACLYTALVHLVVLALLWDSWWPGLMAFRLGLGSRWLEFDQSFKNRVPLLQRRASALDPGSALFAGDSQLASLDIGALADRAVQLSIPGETTRRAAVRMRGYGKALAGSRLVFLHVGTNDLRYRPPGELEPGFTRLLELVPAGVPTVLSAILPVDERVFRDYGNAQIRAGNRAIARACEARPGCTLGDASAGLTAADGGLDPRYHTGDRLHLNSDGQRIWRGTLATALAAGRSS